MKSPTKLLKRNEAGRVRSFFRAIANLSNQLQGIELGTHLIKHAVKRLKDEFPVINTFSTLSPIPGFRTWLLSRIQASKRDEFSEILKPDEKDTLMGLLMTNTSDKNKVDGTNVDFLDRLHYVISSNGWAQDDKIVNALQTPLMRLCAQYLYLEKRRNLALNSVANFHLRNGATLWRINWLADLSPRGLTNSCGLMVNYRYFIDKLEENSVSYQEVFQVSAGDQVIQLAAQSKTLL